MNARWQRLLDEYPQYWDFHEWPDIDVDTLPPAARSIFLRNKRIVAKLLAKHRSSDIADTENVTVSAITRLIRRCLQPLSPDAPPPLTAALIPHHPLKPRHRKQALPTLSRPSVATGALNALLAGNESLTQCMDECIRADLRHDPSSQHINVGAFVQEFRRQLTLRQYPMDQYPFTEPRQGYEAIRRYYHRRRAELQLERFRHADPTTPPKQLTVSRLPPLFGLQIDCHRTDMNSLLWLEFNGSEIPLPLSRLSLLVAVEPATRCAVAMHLVLKREASQWDVLQLLHNLTVPFVRPQLTTPGLEYQHPYCFPSDADPSATDVGYSLFQLDNALANIAWNVQDAICNRFHAAYHLGRPGVPQTRNIIEFAFRRLADLLHRLPGTTGSHPQDPRRKSSVRGKKLPKLTLQALADVILLSIADENNLPRVALGGQTPLQAFLATRAQHYYRLLPDMGADNDPLTTTEHCYVHWYKKESRHPHLNFHHLRYSGSALHHANLIGKQVAVKFLFTDLRILRVYRETGEYLGEVYAPYTWQRHPFSMPSLSHINELVKTHRLTKGDPLGSFGRYLLEHKTLPHFALEIPRFWQECTGHSWQHPVEEPDVPAHAGTAPSLVDPPDAPARRIPTWRELHRTTHL